MADFEKMGFEMLQEHLSELPDYFVSDNSAPKKNPENTVYNVNESDSRELSISTPDYVYQDLSNLSSDDVFLDGNQPIPTDSSDVNQTSNIDLSESGEAFNETEVWLNVAADTNSSNITATTFSSDQILQQNFEENLECYSNQNASEEPQAREFEVNGDDFFIAAFDCNLFNNTLSPANSGAEAQKSNVQGKNRKQRNPRQSRKEQANKSPRKARGPKPKPAGRRYPCPMENCDRDYAKSSRLKDHLRKHSGEKPYVCTWEGCIWKFTRSDELNRHSRIHTGIKPYTCQICDKTFARSDHRLKHTRIHAKYGPMVFFGRMKKIMQC